MAENSDDLERLSREQLILKARVLGVERAELMTRVEMRDEIVRRSEPDPAQQKRARGFLGVARDLVASVVEAGLNLPDAAAIIRGDGNRESHWKGPPPVATVTLAEIYAAQGHLDRALRMLDEVLAKEPDHDPARALRTRLATSTDLPVAPPRRRQRVSFADPAPVSVSADIVDPAPVAEIADPAPVSVSAEISNPAPVSVSAEIADPAPVAVSAEIAEIAPVSVSADIVDPAPVAEIAEIALAAVSVEMANPAPVNPPETVPTAIPELEPTSLAASAPAGPALAPVPAPIPSLLTLSLSGQRQIYWELPAQALTALRAHSPSGRPVVRVISFRTRSGRVERSARDLVPDSEVGFAVLADLRADAVVRAVLGWEADGRFMPYLVASDLSSGTPSALRKGPFRANPLVGSVAPEAEQRALSYCSRRPAH